MENKKGSEVFLGVIGVATLIVAIIGATFAYFSADARSGNEAVNVASTSLTIAFEDDGTGLNTDMIPTVSTYAIYAATNEKWIAKETIQSGTNTYQGKGECVDDNGNIICSTYTFTLANPNHTTTLDIEGEIFTTYNDFTNLKFAIYDEANNQVQAPTLLDNTHTSEELFTTTLLPSSKDVDEDGKSKPEFNAEDISTFTHVTENFKTLITGDFDAAFNNVRTYKMIIWIDEIGSDQTEADSGKVFAGGVTFSTLGGQGVTGMIAVAKQA